MIPIILVCGPSGSGKTTLVDHVLDQDMAIIRRIRSLTTRPIRADKEEQDRETYTFTSKTEFLTDEANGKIIEWDEFCGNFYGTPVSEFADTHGEDALIKVATAPGIAGFKRWLDDSAPPPGEAPRYQIFTILVDADSVALASRLEKRGDDPEALRARLASSLKEKEAYNDIHWDYTIDTSYVSVSEAALMFEAAVLGILSVCSERNRKWAT